MLLVVYLEFEYIIDWDMVKSIIIINYKERRIGISNINIIVLLSSNGNSAIVSTRKCH